LAELLFNQLSDYPKRGSSMIELFDFTVGIISGVVVSFLGYYMTDVFRERKRHVRVVKAFIQELMRIKDDINLNTPYKSATVGTPVFSKLITELPLLRELTAEQLLNTYSDIKFYLRPDGAMTTNDLKKLGYAIETTIKFLREEIEHKPKRQRTKTMP
jgi:hypothetical protein